MNAISTSSTRETAACGCVYVSTRTEHIEFGAAWDGFTTSRVHDCGGHPQPKPARPAHDEDWVAKLLASVGR